MVRALVGDSTITRVDMSSLGDSSWARQPKETRSGQGQMGRNAEKIQSRFSPFLLWHLSGSKLGLSISNLHITWRVTTRERQIVFAIARSIDAISWNNSKKMNNRLPEKSQKGLEKNHGDL